MKNSPAVPDTWDVLRRYTPARIALGRSGVSLPTGPQLAFQLAHARARDAVHRPWDLETSTRALEAQGYAVLHAQSAAPNRATYLQRPDLGRRLDPASAAVLKAARGTSPRFDLGVVVADGLSALAVERHAVEFLKVLSSKLNPADAGPPWRLAPVVLVQQGRVAVGDEVGECLGLDMVMVLIGERPGLSSPDSMGLYLTWAPKVGCNDAQRNCISNIRPEGLNYAEAAHRAAWLLSAARTRALTGVDLKDESAPVAQLGLSTPGFSLTDRQSP